MSQYTNYESLNALEEFSMIGGNNIVLTFNVFQDDGVTPLNIAGATIAWVMAPYGQPDNPVLQKAGSITGTGIFTVTIASADTESLASGKYIHQPIITSGGAKYKPTQGSILIQKAITTV